MKKKAVGRKKTSNLAGLAAREHGKPTRFPALPAVGLTLFEEAVQLSLARGSVHYVDDNGQPAVPLHQAEFRDGTQAVVAAKVESLLGKRILVRMDDPDNVAGESILRSEAHVTVKNTGVVLEVGPGVEGVVKGDKVFWAGARSSDFPATIPGADQLVVLRCPEEVMGTLRETVRVRRATGAVEAARAELRAGEELDEG